jgi:hypothetical protein
VFFLNRIYGRKALVELRELFFRHVGPVKHEAAFGAFANLVLSSLQSKGTTVDGMMKEYRRARLTHIEAAVSLLDGLVGHLKEVAATRKGELSEELKRSTADLIDQFERTLDGYVKAHATTLRVIPRNGRVGASMDEGMAQFLRPLKPS